MKTIEIKAVHASATWSLRHRVLRPHQPVEMARYPEDDQTDSIHVAALIDGDIVGVASVYREAEPGVQDAGAWRLRGMATSPDVRGQGFGGQVLQLTLQLVAAGGGRRIWCNARSTVKGFYERYGFEAVGDEFEMAGIGPHFLMKKTL